MRFRKGSLIIENNNPVCDSLYLRQGWIPVEDTPVVIEKSAASEIPVPLTAESVPVVDEPITQTESAVKEEVKSPAVKAETTKAKSTTQKRTYQKHK